MYNEQTAKLALLAMWAIILVMLAVGLVLRRSAQRQKARNDIAQAQQQQAQEESSRPPLTA